MSSPHAPGLSFKVKVGEIAPVVFHEASGLEPGVSEKVVLKKGVVPIGGAHGWFTEHLDKLAWSKVRPMDVTIHSLDAKGHVLQTWTLTKAFPLKWGVCQQAMDGKHMSVEQIDLLCESLTAS